MKIGFVIPAFLGGAPQSAAALAELLHENGHEIFFFAGNTSHADDLLKGKYSVVKIEENYHVSLWRRLASGKSLIAAARNHGMELLFANSYHCVDITALASARLGIPAVLCKAGGAVTSTSAFKRLSNFNWIVYSEENLEAARKAGLKKNVAYISSRFTFDTKYAHAVLAWEPLFFRLAYVAHMRQGNSNGIVQFLARLKEHQGRLASGGRKIEIVFYGDGEYRDEIRRRAAELDASVFEVEFKGMCVPVMPELVERPTIVMGKGRSVIEPAAYGLPAFVLSETGKPVFIQSDRLDLLAEGNFSGRNTASIDDFDSLLSDLSTNRWDGSINQNVSSEIRSKFDINNANRELLRIFTQAAAEQDIYPVTKLVGKILLTSLLEKSRVVKRKIIPHFTPAR